MNFSKEFKNYGVKHFGMSSTMLDQWEKIQSSRTPYILEEREMRVSQIDVFSRLLKDRIIFLTGTVDQNMCDIVQAQLLFLDNVDQNDITFQINSGGGSVLSGLSIVDVMNYIKSDVATVNVGLAASMGSILLTSGTKGKRSSLIYSRIMTHQVSHGTEGNLQDTRINQLEAEKYNFILFKMLSQNSGKTFDEILEASRRDKWFDSDQALEFGLIDEIIGLDKNKSITEMMKGFDEYYQKEVYNKVLNK